MYICTFARAVNRAMDKTRDGSDSETLEIRGSRRDEKRGFWDNGRIKQPPIDETRRSEDRDEALQLQGKKKKIC